MIFTEDSLKGGLYKRSMSRQLTLMESTMALVAAFMSDGDTEDAAKAKVKLFSQDITSRTPGVKYDFILGDTQPLKDSVQDSVLADMTQAKKDVVLNILNTAV
jgi:hypothetical protein